MGPSTKWGGTFGWITLYEMSWSCASFAWPKKKPSPKHYNQSVVFYTEN